MEIKSVPQDPGKRRNMSDFHKDDRDYIRRFYIDRGLCQLINHDFPFRDFGKSRDFKVVFGFCSILNLVITNFFF